MLKKLFKYDWRAMSRTWALVAVLLAVIIGVACPVLRIANRYIDWNRDCINASMTARYNVWQTVSAVTTIVAILAAAIFLVLVVILIFMRFYRNFFTDEAYLTFTLPVSRRQLLLSKTLANYLLLFLSTLEAFLLGLYATMVIPEPNTKLGDKLFNFNFFRSVRKLSQEIIEEIGKEWFIFYVVAIILFALLLLLFETILVQYCLSLGGTLVQKNRLLLSIGLFYGVTNVLTALLEFLILYGLLGGMEVLNDYVGNWELVQFMQFLCPISVGALLCTFGVCALFYGMTLRRLENKLNLA